VSIKTSLLETGAVLFGFEGIFCFHLQGRRLRQQFPLNRNTDVITENYNLILLTLYDSSHCGSHLWGKADFESSDV
jgi:hypothetical protein